MDAQALEQLRIDNRAAIAAARDHHAAQAAKLAAALEDIDRRDALRRERMRHPAMVGRYPRRWTRDEVSEKYNAEQVHHPNLIFIPADVADLEVTELRTA